MKEDFRLKLFALNDELTKKTEKLNMQISSKSKYDLQSKISSTVDMIIPTCFNLTVESSKVGFLRHLIKAKQSIYELNSYLTIVQYLNYCESTELMNILKEIENMIDEYFSKVYQNYN